MWQLQRQQQKNPYRKLGIGRIVRTVADGHADHQQARVRLANLQQRRAAGGQQVARQRRCGTPITNDWCWAAHARSRMHRHCARRPSNLGGELLERVMSIAPGWLQQQQQQPQGPGEHSAALSGCQLQVLDTLQWTLPPQASAASVALGLLLTVFFVKAHKDVLAAIHDSIKSQIIKVNDALVVGGLAGTARRVAELDCRWQLLGRWLSMRRGRGDVLRHRPGVLLPRTSRSGSICCSGLASCCRRRAIAPGL